MQMSKVLVVDSNHATRDALVAWLKFAGLEAHGADSATAARCWLTTGVADVLVLSDEFSEGVPADPGASILVLARARAAPVAIGRIVERVESLIEERNVRREAVLQFGELTLDAASGRASNGESQVVLGHIEARLLALFMNLPDMVFSRTQLLRRLWPANVRVEERTVDAHIRRLRVSLSVLGCEGYVQTVRCSGYRFSAF